MRHLWLSAFLAFPSVVLAQSFTPGYVVVEGDTLRGQIQIGTEGEAATGALFQSPADPAPQRIETEDASAFGEDRGRAYRVGRFRLRPADPAAPDPSRGFARVVRDGAADLLRFETVGGGRVFVLEVDGERTPLYVLERQAGASGAPRIQGVAEYRQVLLGLLGSCDAVANRARSARYQERDLAAVVDAFNACRDPLYVALEPRPARRRPSRLGLDLFGGYSSSNFHRASPLSEEDPGQSSVHLGALAEFTPGTFPRSLSFLVGAEYDAGMVQRANRPILTSTTETAHDGVMLSLGGRATVSAGRTALFLGGGILNGKTIERVTRTLEPGGEPEPGFLRSTTREFFTSMGGVYAEAGIRPLGQRFGIGVRYRDIMFSQKSIYLPGDTNRDDRYGLRSIQLSATARL